MRTAIVALAVLFGPSVARAEPPSGFAFEVVSVPEVDAFAQDAIGAARAELARAGLLEVTSAEARLFGRDAAARQRVDRARSLFAQAVRSYDNLELDDAIAKLGRVVADLDAGWAAVDDPAVLVDALLRLGAALVLDGRPRDAEAPFARVHELAPDRQPDPEIYPEQVVSRFQQVVDRVSRAGLGRLQVRAAPEGALVTVDGRFRGHAPTLVEDLAPGTHLVRVRAAGFVDQAASATLHAGRTETVSVRLAPTDGGEGLGPLLGELATDEAGVVPQIAERLGLRVVVVLRFGRGDAGSIAVEGVRYDASAASAAARRAVTVSDDSDGVEEVVRLAVALVRERGRAGHDGSSADGGGGAAGTGNGEGHTPASGDPGIASRWWFWTGVAAVVVAGVVVGVVLATSGDAQSERPAGELVLRF